VLCNDDTSDFRQHNEANEITARTLGRNARIIEHDAAGNLHLLQDETGTTGKKFIYDYRNRLIEVYTTTDITAGEPVWQRTISYYYDALNRRVEKDLDTGTDLLYIYDGLTGVLAGVKALSRSHVSEDMGSISSIFGASPAKPYQPTIRRSKAQHQRSIADGEKSQSPRLDPACDSISPYRTFRVAPVCGPGLPAAEQHKDSRHRYSSRQRERECVCCDDEA